MWSGKAELDLGSGYKMSKAAERTEVRMLQKLWEVEDEAQGH